MRSGAVPPQKKSFKVSTRDRHYQKWASHSQNGKAVDGSPILSSVRDAAFTSSGFPKTGQFCASVEDEVIVDAQVTADGTVNVDNGVADANDTFIAGSEGLSLDLQGEPSTYPVRSEGRVRGTPKKGSSGLRSSTQVPTMMILQVKPSLPTLQMQMESYRKSSLLVSTLKDGPK